MKKLYHSSSLLILSVIFLASVSNAAVSNPHQMKTVKTSNTIKGNGRKGNAVKPLVTKSNMNRKMRAAGIAGGFGFSASIGTFNSIASTGTGISSAAFGSGYPDDGTADRIPIGFDFIYDQTAFSEVAVCTNGWLSFDSANTYSSNGYFTIRDGRSTDADLSTDDGMRPFVTPLYGDLLINGQIFYETDGTAPNRKFTVEWNNVAADYGYEDSNSVSFQVILYEGTGEIQFAYTPGPQAAATFDNPSNSGLCAGLADDNGGFISVSTLSNSATISSVAEGDTLFTPPPDGLTFTFVPVPHASVTPFSDIGPESVTLNGMDYPLGSSLESRFLIGRTPGVYTDSIEASPFTVSGSPSPISAALSGLTPGTKYYCAIAFVVDGSEYVLGNEMSFTTAYLNAGKAMKFYSDNAEWLYTPDVMTTSTSNFTIEAWVNWSGPSSDNQILFYNGTPFVSGYGVYLYGYGSNEVSYDQGNVAAFASDSVLTPGHWTHIALTCDATPVWVLYVDGVAVMSGNQAAPVPVGNFLIGGTPGNSYTFNGLIDEVRFWDVCLTQSQIQLDMHRVLTGNESNLLGYWQFNEDAGTSVHDLTIYANSLSFMDFVFDGSDGCVNSTAPLGAGTSSNSGATYGTTTITTSQDVTWLSGSSYYWPVDIVFTKIQTSPNVLPGSATDLSSEYWIIEPYRLAANPGPTLADLTFTVPSAYTKSGAASPASYILYFRGANSDEAWTPLITGASAVTATTVEFDGVDTLGQFMIGSSATDIGLPVQATDFVAKSDVGCVTISWKTQSEVDNAGFKVMKQPSGAGDWQLAGSYSTDKNLVGLGTSSTGRSYSFTDDKVTSGKSYNYKIQSVSTNGTIKDLSTLAVKVDVPKSYALYQNYPNPFNPSTTIRFDLKEQSTVILEVYNSLGQRVESWSYGQMQAGRYDEKVSLSRFASGIYFCKLSAVGIDGQTFTSIKKLMLVK